MSLANLGRFRTLIPGVLLVGPVWVIFGNKIESSALLPSPVLTWAGFLTISYAVGMVYEVTGLRRALSGLTFRDTTTGIVQRLTNGLGYAVLMGREQKVFDAIKPAYYQTIDNDNSLKQHAERIRKNGLAVSSLADALVISTLYTAIFILVWAGRHEARWLIGACAALGLAAVVAVLLMLAAKNHRELCLDQVDVILSRLPEGVATALSRLITDRPDWLRQ